MPQISNEDKLYAFLCYLGPLIIIPLLVKKKSIFVLGHMKQGLMFIILYLVVWMISRLPLIKYIGILLNIILFIVWIIAIVKVFSGKEFTIPFFGEIAEKWRI